MTEIQHSLSKFNLTNGKNPHMQRCTYFAKSEQCYRLKSTDADAVEVGSVDGLNTSQEEADARIILYVKQPQILSCYCLIP